MFGISLIVMIRDAFPFQNRWIFGKVPNSLWPPPPFGKSCCRFVPKIHDQSTLYNGKNLQHKFLDLKWSPPSPPPLRNFSENSSVLVGGGFPKYLTQNGVRRNQDDLRVLSSGWNIIQQNKSDTMLSLAKRWQLNNSAARLVGKWGAHQCTARSLWLSS